MTSWTFLPTVLVICLIGGCKKPRSTLVLSPDGSMAAVPYIADELTIIIRSKAGTELYRWKTGASTYQRWTVEWKDNNTLEMESADIGAYILERLPDGTWRESTPGGIFSPDGKQIVQTSWESKETKKLRLSFAEVNGGRRNCIYTGEFQTDLPVADPFSCARWDGNNRVIVTTLDGEHSWFKQTDGTWAREK